MSANLEKVEAIFIEALKLNPAERPAFLDGACGNEAELRGRLEELLRAEAQAGAFLPVWLRPGRERAVPRHQQQSRRDLEGEDKTTTVPNRMTTHG